MKFYIHWVIKVRALSDRIELKRDLVPAENSKGEKSGVLGFTAPVATVCQTGRLLNWPPCRGQTCAAVARPTGGTMAVFALEGHARRAAQRRCQLTVGERHREFESTLLRHAVSDLKAFSVDDRKKRACGGSSRLFRCAEPAAGGKRSLDLEDTDPAMAAI
jgi:hypothetical protein